jgi:hypothetical protein
VDASVSLRFRAQSVSFSSSIEDDELDEGAGREHEERSRGDGDEPGRQARQRTADVHDREAECDAPEGRQYDEQRDPFREALRNHPASL